MDVLRFIARNVTRRSRPEQELTCEALVELVTEYLEGSLPVSDEARFEAHLAECSDCDAHLAQMRATIAALGRIPVESVSSDTERALAAAFADWRAGA